MSALHDAARRVVAEWGSTRPTWVEEMNEAMQALDAALKAEPAQEPFSIRELLFQAAAMAVAAERAGQYEGASWVADAVLAQEQPEPAQEPVACSNTFACRCQKHFSAPPQPEPAQEPVAWMYELARNFNFAGYGGWEKRVTEYRPHTHPERVRNITPLYTAPPQRPPLTDEEISDIYIDWDITPGRRIADLVRAIERKVRGE